MTRQPLVSVIVPAWNSQDTLAQTLESVVEQTYPNIEILIVDDGSTDATAAVAELFCAREPRSKLIRKENGGLASARNCGIEQARGEWIAPIDADDLWHPTKIAKQMAVALAASEPIGFVYCWYRQVDEDGRVLASGPRLSLSGRVLGQLAAMNAVENGSALLLSRKALFDVGGYDESLPALEDVMLQLRVASRYRIDLVPEHLVGWRRHSSNMSADIDLIARCSSRVYRRLRADGLVPPRTQRWLAGRSAFNTAEQRAVAGRPVAALANIAKALVLDPLRNGFLLAYRILRTTRRRLGPTAPVKALPHFYEVDPSAKIATDPYQLERFSAFLRKLDERRLARLAKRDPQQR